MLFSSHRNDKNNTWLSCLQKSLIGCEDTWAGPLRAPWFCMKALTVRLLLWQAGLWTASSLAEAPWKHCFVPPALIVLQHEPDTDTRSQLRDKNPSCATPSSSQKQKPDGFIACYWLAQPFTDQTWALQSGGSLFIYCCPEIK